MRPSTPPADSRTFHRGARERAFAKLVVLRLYLAPAIGALALAFAFFEPTPWRRVVLGAVVVLVLAVSVEEFVRSRRGSAHGELQLPLNLLVMALAQLSVVTATGGLLSPVVPGLLAIVVLGGVLLERRAILGIVLGLQAPALWAMAWVHVHGAPVPSLVPEVFGGALPFERGVAPWVLATIYTVVLFGGSRVGLLIRAIFEDLFAEGMRERDRVLAMHAEQNRALSALSAELAHELKNPLASVKGLAALVAKSEAASGREGKSAERLEVLRREVDRMQGILEELLTFSRPLVPLTMEALDLSELARDVARLYEASAAERGVRLRVDAEELRLRCDPRKVRQVLINLVQNALDASPRGGAVTLVVDADGDAARVCVLDEGPGLPDDVADRVFEAGVTTKERGSGLGLVVARSLARQHGGELVLLAREPGGDGRGCEARLTLPRAPEASA